jgi:putative effector of murein hydrolase
MKRALKSPVLNAICLCLFSAFYTVVYILIERPMYVAWPMIVITGIIVATLLMRRRKYDEYHAAILANCLIAALVLTMIAIAVFYVIILTDPNAIVEKFGLFIDIHWVTVLLSDFAFVVLCRRK